MGNAPPDSTAGIFKFNADGSPADEGGFSRSYPWPGGQYNPGYLYSPWKIAVALDDTVYINDWSQSGLALAFDEVISANYLTALNSGNYPSEDPTPFLSGPFVTGGGTNTRLWMADANTDGNSVGVLRYDVSANGAVADNDSGTVVVGISPTGLTLCAYDAAVDASSNIYVIQSLDGFADPGDYFSTPRLFCFPPYTNTEDLTTNWSVSSEDYSLENAVGVAVDPTGTWVAVAVRGYNNGSEGELAKRRRRPGERCRQRLLRHQWRPGCQPRRGYQRPVHGRGLGQVRKSLCHRPQRPSVARLVAARDQSGGDCRCAGHPSL